MRFHAYLNFNGDCAQAFRHYQDVLGGELEIMTHAESPVADQVPQDWGDRVMHAALRVGDELLMASDAPPEHYHAPAGMYVSIWVDTVDEGRRVFDALAEGGQIHTPYRPTFWSRGFGMLADRWGTRWMVNCAAQPEPAEGQGQDEAGSAAS